MSQDQENIARQVMPAPEACCLCGAPLAGEGAILFRDERGVACVDAQCLYALSVLAGGSDKAQVALALEYVRNRVPNVHPVVRGHLDAYLSRGELIAPSAPAEEPPPAPAPAPQDADRRDRLFRALARCVLAVTAGLIGSFLVARVAFAPVPFILCAWLALSLTCGLGLYQDGISRGRNFINARLRPQLYSTTPRLLLVMVFSVLFGVCYALALAPYITLIDLFSALGRRNG